LDAVAAELRPSGWVYRCSLKSRLTLGCEKAATPAPPWRRATQPDRRLTLSAHWRRGFDDKPVIT
jgi:hypothetical protein